MITEKSTVMRDTKAAAKARLKKTSREQGFHSHYAEARIADGASTS